MEFASAQSSLNAKESENNSMTLICTDNERRSSTSEGGPCLGTNSLHGLFSGHIWPAPQLMVVFDGVRRQTAFEVPCRLQFMFCFLSFGQLINEARCSVLKKILLITVNRSSGAVQLLFQILCRHTCTSALGILLLIS